MGSDPGGTYDRPLEIDTHGGEVVITGPGPQSIALTAKAAAQSADRLAAAARQASDSDARVGAEPSPPPLKI